MAPPQNAVSGSVVERCISLDDSSEWDEALRGIPHGFGHTWGSCHAFSLTSRHRTFLYEASEDDVRVLCPLDERAEEEHRDVATPYGFSGFVGTALWPGFPEVWASFVRRRGYVCGYVALSPLFGDRSYASQSAVWKINDAYVLDLSDGLDSLWRRLPRDRRQRARRWRTSVVEADPPRLKAFFVETYPRLMESKDAVPYYRFTSDTLEAICDLPNVFLLAGGSKHRVEAVSVFGYTPHAADYLFTASAPGGERHTVPLLWSAVHRLVELGVPLLNLGGGLRPGDSLAECKARFGGRRLPRYALKEVYDEGTYTRLCRSRGREPALRDGFFPAYRDP